MDSINSLSEKQKEFDKIARAYEQVKETGYGIVMPTIDQLTLDEPQIIKQSGKYGIKLRASAPSIHMMKIETQTEVTPIVGSEQQSEELVNYLLKEFEENPEKIWESNIFGKSVHELVNEGLHNKLYRMPSDARRKIGETIQKIINDGCKSIGESAFAYCENLNDIYIAASVDKIDKRAFEYIGENPVFHAPSGSKAERYANSMSYAHDNNI